MTTGAKKNRMRRTQISLTAEDYESAKRLATERGVSLSEVFRNALRKEAKTGNSAYDALRAIIGIVDNADPEASENLDQIIYGRDIR